MNILSFDVGGTTIKYGLVNQDFEVLSKGSIKTPDNENNFLNIIDTVASKYLDKFEKISIAMPGFVSKKESKYLYGTNIKYEIDFRSIYQTILTNWLQVSAEGIINSSQENLGFI